METQQQALKRRVDRIIAMDDDERQHSEEDTLLRELVDRFAPDWAIAEVERLAEADFARWYA